MSGHRVREIVAIICKFMANDDSVWNEAEFSGIGSLAEYYKGIESHGGGILLRN